MKKRELLILLSFLIGGAIIYFVFQKIGVKEIWEAFLSFSPWGVFWVLILTVLYHLTAAWRLKVILEDKKYPISTKGVFSTWLASFALAYFTPIALMADGVLRAYILKEKYSVPWKENIISNFIDKLLDGTIFFLTIITGIIFFILHNLTIPIKLWMAILILLFPIGGITFFYYRAFKNQSMLKLIEKPIQKMFKKLPERAFFWESELFDFFKSNNKNMWKAMVFNFVRGIINWSRCWVLLLFLGLPINWIESLIIVGFTNLAYVLPIPAAIGSHEAIQAFTFSKLGFQSHNAIAFTLILRAFDVLIGIVGIGIAFRFGTKRLRKIINNPSVEQNEIENSSTSHH
ncbi:MAG TPA: lysylphosphatidylglycerol synthase transmembrane domain-containing protein [Candidatus Pacearchaeota archaeon]|nr:lysylphosphatidylglycerol synthase transmembrane domain-containing protein [Candidatus Pacearchaeota archaeon]HPZ74255.1 lysylphosphatidylglycerol synthase transmembrane domain-containing protein [Candidatus Pacearchaeota archaeon]HQD88985.1 lysylphosphatidylglycerol synthase transmembrane domain-containing protein [Candidatus Pacearchaeota archaeon]